MEDGRVLADTSLFIEHLRSRDKTSTTLFRLTEQFNVETSAVVAAEVFFGARTEIAERQAWSVLRPFPIHPFTVEMAARMTTLLTGLIHINRIPDIRDMMIATASIEMGIPLATLNLSHFEAVPGLSLVTLPRASGEGQSQVPNG